MTTIPILRRTREGLRSGRRQRGAAAVEFAVVFLVFFALFYGIVSYALAFMLMQGFSFAANEGARAAIAVDRLAYSSDADYLENGVKPRVREVVSDTLSWLPGKALAAAVGAGGSKVSVAFDAQGAVKVEITYPGYTADPLIPVLSLPGMGAIPRLPENLTGVSVIGL